MRIYRWVILLLALLIAGCNSGTSPATITPGATETPSATVVLPTPVQKTTPVPNADDAVRAYLDAWKADEYASMYAMLTTVGQDAITEEDFTNWYRTVATEAALSSVDYEILSSLVRNTRSAQANYRVILRSVLVGDIQRDTVMHLSLEDGAWRVQWSDDLIIPELAGGNYLWMDRHIPARANIYDREGNTVAAYAEAVSIGIIPGQIDPGTEEALLSDLQWMTGMNANAIAAMYEDFPPGAEWYLALGEVLLEKVQTRYDVSNGYNDNGLLMFPFESRFYFDNGIASQSIGYVSLIQVDEMEQYLRQGYNRDEKVGRQGIESWGEPYLGGTRGGTLYVIGPDDKVVTQLADVAAKPAQAIYTSLDSGLQLAAQTALLKFRGAVLVLERDTGRVLAMASSPGYDPNAFEPSNYNYRYQLEEIYSA